MSLLVEQVGPVLTELEEAFFDIPFENSDFQNRNFVVAAQLTPARAYRAIGLRMFAKIRAVKEALYGAQLQDIDIEEGEYKAAQPGMSDFDKRRLAIENAKLLESRKWTEKLLNDALRELDSLYQEFKKYPKYTREQFESEEQIHFHQRLTRQVEGIDGARDSLSNMLEDRQIMDRFLTDMAGDPEKLGGVVNQLIRESEQMRLAQIGGAGAKTTVRMA